MEITSIYDISFVCNYNNDEAINEDMCDMLYRENIIRILKLDDLVLDDELFNIMSKRIDMIYDYLSNKDLLKYLKDIFEKIEQNLIFSDLLFTVLFSYDYLSEAHEYIKYLIINRNDNKELHDNLYNKIKI